MAEKKKFYIYNRKTKMIHPCANKDVANWCRSRGDEYLVSEDKEKLMQVIILEEENEPVKEVKASEPVVDLSKMKVDEIKAYAESKGIDTPSGLNKAELVAFVEDALEHVEKL